MTLQISGLLYEDIVGLDGTSLTLPAQILGTVADPASPPSFPHDGLVGFAGLSQSAIKSASWFQHLCDHGFVDECRFGLAFETDDTGIQYFGYVDEERFYGDLSVAPVVPNEEWASWMDIAYDGKVIEEDAWVVTDSGTTIIFGLIFKLVKIPSECILPGLHANMIYIRQSHRLGAEPLRCCRHPIRLD